MIMMINSINAWSSVVSFMSDVHLLMTWSMIWQWWCWLCSIMHVAVEPWWCCVELNNFMIEVHELEYQVSLLNHVRGLVHFHCIARPALVCSDTALQPHWWTLLIISLDLFDNWSNAMYLNEMTVCHGLSPFYKLLWKICTNNATLKKIKASRMLSRHQQRLLITSNPCMTQSHSAPRIT